MKTIVNFLPPGLHYDELHPVPCFDLHNLHQTLSASFHLLGFTLQDKKAIQLEKSQGSGTYDLRWIINVLPQIDVFVNHFITSPLQEPDTSVTSFVTFIDFLHRLLMYAAQANSGVTATHRIITTLCSILEIVVQRALPCPSQGTQLLICRSLIGLYASSVTSVSVSAVFYSQVVPFFQILADLSDQITNIGADLQVI